MKNQKKRGIVLITLLFILVSAHSVYGWLGCTPVACPAGYTDNGITCTGGTCTRSCTALACDIANWTQVYTTLFGFSEFVEDEASSTSTGYTPTDTTKCYNFTYQGPPANDDNVAMHVWECTPDYDSEMIGGFKQSATPPWFDGMNDFITGKQNLLVNDMVRAVRAHDEDTSDQPYRDSAAGSNSIYCTSASVACNISLKKNYCDTDCYNISTMGHVLQGYYRDEGTANSDDTLYRGVSACSNIQKNFMTPVTFTVYESPRTVTHEKDQTCDRTNEPPSVSNVKTIPLNATAAQDLECNYTYTDPEGFAEQNTSFEWWKNGIKQGFNPNASVVGKGNLTVGDVWYCKVIPGDGLTIGTKVQSSNNVVILTTVQDIKMYVSSKLAKSLNGYLAGPEIVTNFAQEINDALKECTPDVQGYCTIPLTFSSSDEGILNFSALGIYYTTYAQEQEARPLIEQGITNALTANYTLYTDQPIYVHYLNNTQRQGTFDKVALKGNQTWAFNYVTGNETFTNITSMYNNTLVVWENHSIYADHIIKQIEELINKTKWQ